MAEISEKKKIMKSEENKKRRSVGIELTEMTTNFDGCKGQLSLTVVKLNILPKWSNVPKPGEGNVEEEKKRLKEIVDCGIPTWMIRKDLIT